MKDWIWYHWVVKGDVRHKRITAIYWNKRHKHWSWLLASAEAQKNFTRFIKCKKRWH